ncbi:hypothetical protein AB4Z09_11975 [Rhodococcus sp. TAF43]|uniref:hypothetical protein n=1 Tax=unclassified Rhodococcus (in: high G+C Gram-positive bacteria) TaxID=192944 RepID=UPI0011C04F6F|nr:MULTISPECIES: hypothetical protein [unclassified Rhodococcus (in: high G+C Gram-positive bacteria)]QKT12432.1 hypothetical protein HUN07_18540 [Rhodococcus sp. W8901]
MDKFVGAFRAFVMHAYGREVPVHGLHKVATLPGGKIDRRKKCLCWCTRLHSLAGVDALWAFEHSLGSGAK